MGFMNRLVPRHWSFANNLVSARGIHAAAIVLALLFCALVTSLTTGENPLQVYSTMIYGAVGTPRKIWILGQNIALLLCVSLAVTPAFRMRFWNIGGEGQVLAGALAAAACMICLSDKLPNGALIVGHRPPTLSSQEDNLSTQK